MPIETTITPALPLPEFAAARDVMVDGQLRPNRVSDPRIVNAMRSLPREEFVPAAQRAFAYSDEALKFPGGRTMLKPLPLARLLQLANPVAGEAALVIGAGTGYGAAILAACGAHVTALEEDAALLAQGRAACAAALPNAAITFVHGKLADGCAQGAPYDLVVIEGGVRAIPERIARMVAQTGRLVCIVVPEGGVSVAILAEPTVGGLSVRPAFDAAAALLPELAPAPVFVF